MNNPKLYFHEKVVGELKLRKLQFGTLEENLSFMKQVDICDKIVAATNMLPHGAVMTVVK